MKPQELKYSREFNKIKTEIEDIVMTTGVDLISQYSDTVGQEKVIILSQLRDEVKAEMIKITDLDKFNEHFDTYLGKHKILKSKFDEIIKYLMPEGEFSDELLKVLRPSIAGRLEQLNEIRAVTHYLNYQRTTNRLDLQVKIMVDNIVYCLNKTSDEVIKPYKIILVEIMEDMYNLMQEHTDKLHALCNEEIAYLNKIQKSNNSKLKKILDIRSMDALLKGIGYEPVRQKGSHKIYSDGVNSVPVPIHSTLHKGLAYTIQKEVRG